MSILHRTIYFDKPSSDGICRFVDWATVTTTLGAMVEPFTPNQRYSFGPFQDFDATDEVERVDNIRAIPDGNDFHFLCGDAMQLHGGVQMPKVGR